MKYIRALGFKIKSVLDNLFNAYNFIFELQMNVDDVVHCPYSCGLSLSHTSGWSLAYTGDAYELSHSFIKNGREFPFSPVGVLNLSLILILYQEQ